MAQSLTHGVAAVLRSWLAVCLLAAGALLAGAVSAQGTKTFTNEQLDQLLAPIALYPDSLLSQVLMASTYPADIVEAAKWSKENSKQQGDAAVKAVEGKGWDPSVASLVAFPQVIQTLGGQPEQVQKLGDAFLAQPKEVMDSVQRLRAQANKAGNLKSNEQQKVVTEPAPAGGAQQTVIKIEPTNPEVVYVPAYNPTVVYGAWAYPAYPPYYWPPPVGYYPGSALAAGIAFGVGVGVVNSLWGNCNWGGGDVNINVNKYNNVNANNRITNAQGNNSNWNHNASNRKGVPYGDSSTRQKYDRQVAGANDRQGHRGQTDNRSGDRARAEQTLQQRGLDPAQGRDSLANDPATQERARAAAQNADRSAARDSAQNRSGSHDNAFAGARDNGNSRQQADRGSASRESMDRSAGGRDHGGGARQSAGNGGGRAGSGGGGGRGGGGGGGRGGGGRR